MEKLYLIFLIIAGSLISSGISTCQLRLESSRPFDIGFGSEPKVNSYIITCFNVSTDSIIDDHITSQKFGYHDRVLVNMVNSRIPILSANFSLSTLSPATSLNFTNLAIEEISPGAFRTHSNLKFLYLSSNNLKKIVKGAFDGIQEMTVLDLSKNNIEEIEEGSFDKFRRLNNLLLNGNKLQIVYQHFTKGLILDVLDVSDNPLQEFQEFGTNHVGNLKLRGFPLKTFPLNLTDTEIYYLEIDEGQLETIDFALLPYLSIFNVSHNKIKSVQNWDKMRGYHFNFDNNLLTEADISDRVQLLHLSHNKITDLKRTPYEGKSELSILDLSFNEITTVPPRLFRDMIQLHTLDLQNNQIADLPDNTFINCSVLRSLNLSFNNLKRLSVTSLEGLPNDAYVYLSGNPIDSASLAELSQRFPNIKSE